VRAIQRDADIVPAEAIAPALIVVGFLMASSICEIEFGVFEDGLPALLTVVMPFAFSITNGTGVALVTDTFLKLVTGRARQLHWTVVLVGAAFVLYVAVPWVEKQENLGRRGR